MVFQSDFGLVPSFDDEYNPEEYFCKGREIAIQAEMKMPSMPEPEPISKNLNTAQMIATDAEEYTEFWCSPDNDPMVCLMKHTIKLQTVFAAIRHN
jgi:hypothetical protein